MPVLLLGNVCVLFDSRTNLGGGRGVCNDLWLQLITVSLCDGLIRRMYVGRERENSAHERGTDYFARPSRVSQLSLALGHVSLPLITYSSPLCLSMLIGSFFVANTTTRHDYAESLHRSDHRSHVQCEQELKGGWQMLSDSAHRLV